MPDVVNALKFQNKILSVENSYLREIKSYRADARRELLEIIQRDGVSRQAVNQMVNVIDSLSVNLTAISAKASREIKKHVTNYMQKQVDLSVKLGVTQSADLSPVLSAGTQAAQDGEQSYMTNNSAWLSQLETSIQTQAARLRISKATNKEIVDRLLSETLADGRASVWLTNTNQANSEESGNVWAYSIGLLSAYGFIYGKQQDTTYQKQAIATIDERTTDCCLRVHGQVQPLDKPFLLSGVPRFADRVQSPPFHWYCRTSEALYRKEFEEIGIPTDKMKSMAELELEQRELTKTRSEIHPSHATSRRKGQLPSG